ncbi:MAG: glycine cleavage T C-terminal barrel domain-containing protein, partial [Pseudomonadota bacterium]
GSAMGIYDTRSCLESGQEAAKSVLQALNMACEDFATLDIKDTGLVSEPLALWQVPSQGKAFVDFQNDVTSSDIGLAHREGYRSVEHLKRYTTTGMGTDQGKTSNVNALALMANLCDAPINTIGTTTFRPPYTPQSFGALAGANTGSRFMQTRTTPMHRYHSDLGAVFEDVGDWKRARYYPQDSEDMLQAVNRECLAVRTHVGLLDASTLGKIDIRGPDATKLLNMVYTNAWNKLGIGKCRYGLMMNENGMVFDDGVTTRLGEYHYHMTTTTGGAARVLSWLEEWLQTEWPHWQVYCTSVTEQWAVATISGPKARDLLQPLCDIDLASENFPFMTMQTGKVAGMPARIFRISFTGELSFEVNIPARFGAKLWRVLYEAGQAHGLVPYGTEAMHVLRAEKGFIIVGQETDGMITPNDLGMEGMVSKTKDCLGKRSLARPEMQRKDRRQLVGFIPVDHAQILPEGAHLVRNVQDRPPMVIKGNITSSYYSSNLGHPFGLAMLEAGHISKGDEFFVPLHDGTAPRVKIVAPVFIDQAGERMRG